jgi:hypothetical protein
VRENYPNGSRIRIDRSNFAREKFGAAFFGTGYFRGAGSNPYKKGTDRRKGPQAEKLRKRKRPQEKPPHRRIPCTNAVKTAEIWKTMDFLCFDLFSKEGSFL